MAFFFQIANLYLVRWEKHERRKNTEIVPFHLKASIRDESNNSTDVKCWFAISLIRKPKTNHYARLLCMPHWLPIYTRADEWTSVCLCMYILSVCFCFCYRSLKLWRFVLFFIVYFCSYFCCSVANLLSILWVYCIHIKFSLKSIF